MVTAPDTRVVPRIDIDSQPVAMPGNTVGPVYQTIVETGRIVVMHRPVVIPAIPWVGQGNHLRDGKIDSQEREKYLLDLPGDHLMHDDLTDVAPPIE